MFFNLGAWADVFHRYPVLIVLAAGCAGGIAITEFAKRAYKAWSLGTQPIPDARYDLGVTTHAILWAFYFTNRLWQYVIGENGTGLRHLVALIAGVCCPLVYSLGMMAIQAWKNRRNRTY